MVEHRAFTKVEIDYKIDVFLGIKLYHVIFVIYHMTVM